MNKLVLSIGIACTVAALGMIYDMYRYTVKNEEDINPDISTCKWIGIGTVIGIISELILL